MKVTSAKRAANGANARRSTGPRTDGGDCCHDELIARYETAAERTLQARDRGHPRAAAL